MDRDAEITARSILQRARAALAATAPKEEK